MFSERTFVSIALFFKPRRDHVKRGDGPALRPARNERCARANADESAFAPARAAEVFGASKVDGKYPPSLVSEDFFYYADHVPCAYGWIGNGVGEEGCVVHNARDDFNNRILAMGASYFARLVEQRLKPAG